MSNSCKKFHIVTYLLLGLTVVSCNNGGSGQQNNITPPHVTDNKVLDDNTCAKFNAGYASALYNTKGSLSGKNYNKIETCSMWYNNNSQANMSTKKLFSSVNPYNFESNTVIAWGQAGANSLLFINESSNIWDILNPEVYNLLASDDGYNHYGSPFVSVTQTNTVLPFGNLSEHSYGNEYQNFPPFFPTSYTYDTMNLSSSDVVPVSAYAAVLFPRVCNLDQRYNYSASVMLTLQGAESSTYQFPVSFLEYCSWQGTTIGTFDNYSTAVQMYGGIVFDQIFNTNPTSQCAYITQNAGSTNSNSALQCNINGNNIKISLQEYFSNLSQQDNCYMSGDGSTGFSGYCMQNGWSVNIESY
ncbi:MAG: hypothetical protein E6Q33_08355 [Neisseriales bacterium]|jgi:hypothetical protein|nr:MAG: hypothetical protein E6Q33_08355 [Neisseriales bacterium]